ncbi:MAG: polyribonucleotide nucleotidyltransferase [Deltaproteobacteria bacterium]|nr:polyribonucleotide nucleotidyltransferase [Deltaproteobacteria bacterium]MBW2594423.1 polyribonucleotide nucleotidyltransferase [Deltaproteobacteria bacterium]MBW2649731.1 polyribonucleotide nucleotidyltransferase [Deltaproteobacteria bacterium]
MSEVFKTTFAGRDVSVKTNYLAGQADGSAVVTYGDTVVLVTAVSLKSKREGLDFLPLTVDYQEKTFAAGKIPGGFFKREGRLNEKEILTSRIIDRSIRPLFPEGYFHETQIVATVLSVDDENDSNVAAMLGTSVALGMSDIPFKGPIAGVRVGRVDEKLICNPSAEEMDESDLDMFLVGRKVPSSGGEGDFDVNLIMLEGGALEIPEDEILDAISFGLESMKPAIELQDRVCQAVGKAKREVEPVVIGEDLRQRVKDVAYAGLQDAYLEGRKLERYAKIGEVKKKMAEELSSDDAGLDPQARAVFEELEREILRNMILVDKRRIDGRSSRDIRAITSEVGILPRAHGSGLFTRGETQALVVLTLGTSSDEQRLDFIDGEESRTFMLHYNFPPYSVGEARFMRGPGRREIGHGALARRALLPLLPSHEEFPYTIRLVSEVLSSNGSSSMATVCGGSLALMDAGVPIKDTVAGIAMGLLKEGDEVVILSDILGDEDHAGDMDFKVCGTKKGITALQMDIKVDRLAEDILKDALYQAREGREFIIGKMNENMTTPREDLSAYAPRITTMVVKQEKIRDVIGTGGKNIRGIISETGVSMNVDDDGTVTIASSDAQASERAVAMVKALTEEPEIGRIYEGTVKKVLDFGAFVEILPGTDGLVHISQLDNKRVEKVTDVLNEGDTVRVKVIEIDRGGKIRLSRKDALE